MASGANDVDIVVGLKATTYTAGIREIRKSLADLDGQTKTFSSHTTSNMQAASAGIRLLENPLGNNIRAIERLISQSKVLSTVFQAAFPIVGAIAAGSIVTKLVGDVVKLIETAQKMPKALTDGFASLHLASQSSNDALKLTNDLLQNNIDKLQGKTQNNLALQLDEARIKADDLAKSLENDLSKVKSLLDANKLGVFEAGLTGQGRTGSTAGSVKSFFDQINVLGGANNNAIHQYGADSSQAKQSASDLKAKEDAFDQWLARRAAVLANPNIAQGDELEAIGGFGNQDPNKAIITGAQSIRNDSRDSQAERERNAQLVPANKAAEAAATANRKAAEAARKAAEEMARGWAEDAELFKKWQDYEAETTKITGEDYRDREKGNFLSPDANNQISQSGAGSLARITALRQSIDLNKQNSDVIAQQAIQMGVATGQLTKLDAARMQAAIHTQEYTDALQELKEQAEYIKGDKSYTSDEARQAALLNNQTAQGQLNVNRQIQVGQDNQSTNPAATSGLIGAKNALDDFVTASQDAAKQMQELATNTLQGLNDTILHVLTTPHETGRQTRAAFGDYGAGLAKSVAGTALQKGEGAILGGLGFGGGKLGTQSNPMIVRFADGTSGAIGSAGGFLSGFFGGGKGPGQSGLSTALGISSSASDADAAGGGIGTIASTLTDTIPFLASGGPIDGPAIVGEQGPELFNPGTSGTIIPNHKLKNMGSSGHTINIDASGSTDPAQTRVQVMRGIQAAAPHISASTVQSQNQDRRRTPPSQRK
jgi:hypothetical protein